MTKVARHQLVKKTAWPFPPFGTTKPKTFCFQQDGKSAQAKATIQPPIEPERGRVDTLTSATPRLGLAAYFFIDGNARERECLRGRFPAFMLPPSCHQDEEIPRAQLASEARVGYAIRSSKNPRMQSDQRREAHWFTGLLLYFSDDSFVCCWAVCAVCVFSDSANVEIHW